jgi:hypothetical protein
LNGPIKKAADLSEIHVLSGLGTPRAGKRPVWPG